MLARGRNHQSCEDSDRSRSTFILDNQLRAAEFPCPSFLSFFPSLFVIWSSSLWTSYQSLLYAHRTDSILKKERKHSPHFFIHLASLSVARSAIIVLHTINFPSPPRSDMFISPTFGNIHIYVKSLNCRNAAMPFGCSPLSQTDFRILSPPTLACLPGACLPAVHCPVE